MLRKIGYGLLCAGILVSANALASNHNFIPGIGLEYELPAHDPQEFINSWFWTITSTCTIRTQDMSDDIYIEVLRKSGKVNDQNLSMGQNLLLPVHNGQQIIISADSGSKIKLTNLGANTIKATCSTG